MTLLSKKLFSLLTILYLICLHHSMFYLSRQTSVSAHSREKKKKKIHLPENREKNWNNPLTRNEEGGCLCSKTEKPPEQTSALHSGTLKEEEQQEEEEEEGLSLEKVSASHLCSVNLLLFCTGLASESISSQHWRRVSGWLRSTQVHSTGGSRGPLGWMQRLPNPRKRPNLSTHLL